METETIDIQDRRYWLKTVEMLQQNWALVDDQEGGAACVYFLADDASVFDQLLFASRQEAEDGLHRNGFSLYEDDQTAQQLISPPEPPFAIKPHPNGRIYSSGRFWT